MALYLIGDVQGCDAALQHLLEAISFSPSRDTLYLLGDLVNRGPRSARVLRRLKDMGPAAQCLLGNHDLHLLASAFGGRRLSRKDTLNDVLDAPDRSALLEWLRHQHMAMLLTHQASDYLLVHAGVLPSWSATKTVNLAGEVEAVLRGPELPDFLRQMYGNTPLAWRDDLRGIDRLRVIVNALTRLRFCSAAGVMEFDAKEGLDAAPVGFVPWFDVPGRQTAEVVVAFGHWSTLGWLDRTDVLALDSGCVWGGKLSALKLGAGAPGNPHELIQVSCEQAQKPGK
ncbi:MAG: symmetrical bis(5'-nucleosyl)-tetraphosphatase [Rhodoferax sp.]|jgi:bis(5'-nucleosyl)-tetraphosphatase (symmetrical)|uniref:symmetrical bis(5'-nucleosyl)-tetraphosphatase n=1 Tax=Rhodoferax sp. TaxID=50421 RepID=UPI001B662883|nr:symmetrical bis(5'-nucleosyl)-tetraphosphatase [Rhodoferax sp.]MBP8285644.1 symmetrical bis(5'-nucleosyl)-tetraphosphatase [Rhodoferax sp.]MBP9149416.1 symmetrical bis(5'-nucleosyl)-tetraphosphatase [Rhodoferax sp.]MBP9737367.1 symmetrical bis(5'-nucleosyl)-tetraphosphatase [Rhodoferax sp.]